MTLNVLELRRVSDEIIISVINSSTNGTFTLQTDTEVYVHCQFVNGRTYDDITSYIQLETGAVKTVWSPPSITAVDTIARSEINTFSTKFSGYPFVNINEVIHLTSDNFASGQLAPNSGTFDGTSTTRIASGHIILGDASIVAVSCASAYDHRCLFYDYKGTFIDTTEENTWHNGSLDYPVPTDAYTCRICVRKSDNTSIEHTAETGTTVAILRQYKTKETSQLTNKKLSILGDSLSTYAGIGNYSTSETRATADGTWTYLGNACRYPQANLLQNVSDCYWYKLLKHFDMQLGINESIAGSTVVGSSASAISSETRIGHLDDNGTPDIILVNAGTNDIGQDVTVGTFNTESPINYTAEQIASLDCSTFANAFRAMIIRLQHHYPTSTIIVLLPNYTSTYYRPDEADVYNEVIKEVCDYFGVYYIDARTSGVTMFNKASFLPDGIHYNADGMELLYQNIKNELECHFAR